MIGPEGILIPIILKIKIVADIRKFESNPTIFNTINIEKMDKKRARTDEPII